MKLSRRRFLHQAAGVAMLPAMSRIASALDYPTRPVRMIVPYDCGQNVGAHGDPDLRFHGVFRRAEKMFDAQSLLDPFEEQLDLPRFL